MDSLKLENSSQNMAVAFDRAKTETNADVIKKEECALALSTNKILDDTLESNPSDSTDGNGFDPSKQSVYHRYQVCCLNKTSACTGRL